MPFLEVAITCKQGRFTALVNRKPIFSGIDTRFDSFSPSIYKIGMIYTLLSKFFRICSGLSLTQN